MEDKWRIMNNNRISKNYSLLKVSTFILLVIISFYYVFMVTKVSYIEVTFPIKIEYYQVKVTIKGYYRRLYESTLYYYSHHKDKCY